MFFKIKSIAFVVAVMTAGMLVGCSEKKSSTNIITTKPTVEKKRETQAMGDYQQTMNVDWLGKNYIIAVERRHDKSLALANDGAGNKYYDNKITIVVKREDNSVVFEKTFTKADFAAYIDAKYLKNNALLGVVFDKAQGQKLYFAASVGSPDTLSDDFIPFVVSLSNHGVLTISKASQIDSGSDATLTTADEEAIDNSEI